MGEEDTPGIEGLETLPAVGNVPDPLRPLPPVPGSPGDERLEELPVADESDPFEPPKRSGRFRASESARVGLHTIRDLLDLISSDLPVVAVEGGVYRIQQHAYGGAGRRDPGLHRLAAAVIGVSAADEQPADGRDREPLRLLASGVDLDAFAGDAADEEAEGGWAEAFSGALIRICRRAGAVGAALMVRDASGAYQPRRAVGLLRRSAGRLAFASDDTVTTRYLARRIALIADGPLRLISGIDERFADGARERIGRFAFLPARACGRPAYLLLAARASGGPWDAAPLAARLGLVSAGQPCAR